MSILPSPEATFLIQNAFMSETHTHAIETKDRDLLIEGRRLRCRTLIPAGYQGFGQGPTLVLIHEALGCIAQWRRFPTDLVRATGLPLLVYDRYGHGESEALTGPRPTDYLEIEAFKALPQVLAAFRIEAPILLGHSDGGTIALLFAAAFPEIPRAIICEAAHVFLEEITFKGLRHVAASFAKGPLRDGLARHHGDGVDALFYGWNDVWLSPSRKDWDITAQLTAIRAPLLMIQGEDDDYGSPAQVHAVTTRVSGPAEAFLIPDCGHAAHHQARVLVLDRMARFLEKVMKTPPAP